MSQQHYEFGRLNGCAPYGAEYGSEAWIDAQRGAHAARDEEEATRRAASHTASPSAPVQSAPDLSGLAPLAVLGVLGYVVWETISQWSRYQVPYKWVAFYYYALVAYPIKGFGSVWSFFTAPGLTSSGGWNMTFGVVGVSAYGFALLVFIMALWLLLRRKLVVIVVGPAGFALLWWGAHAAWMSIAKG